MNQLHELFQTHFGDDSDTFFVRAPGRVNLIGEHVDYNDGFVLPIAVTMSTRMRLRPRNDRRIELYSTNLDARLSFSLDHLEKQNTWLDYVIGVAKELAAESVPLHGFEGVVDSDVPTASGLSSSAALEVATALAFTHLAQQPMAASDIALLCQRAENRFVGVNCGIMDQMAVAACREDHALLLDCRTLETEQVPFVLKEHSLVVTDSGAPRELAGSAYNERRAQCDEALRVLQMQQTHYDSLRDVSPADLKYYHEVGLFKPIVYKRAKHVVDEITRTLRATDALKRNDLYEFGKLMFESHQSLRELYEVSSDELNWLVDWSMSHAGVLGARLTGAGFGGCTITLIENGEVEDFIARLPQEYSAATGREARCWVCTAAPGAQVFPEGA